MRTSPTIQRHVFASGTCLICGESTSTQKRCSDRPETISWTSQSDGWEPGPTLPDDAYGTDDPGERSAIDARIAGNLHLVPTEPGRYRDAEGDVWTLRADGRWEDRGGESRPPEYTPMLALMAPWTPVIVCPHCGGHTGFPAVHTALGRPTLICATCASISPREDWEAK